MSKPSINWRRVLGESTNITASWNWFILFAGKAAEPVLVVSVLYASVKLLPVVHFPAQFDVVVFIAQFVALDIGGLSLNTLADQAKKDDNDEGAQQARRLSIALVGIMLVGVIMAGVDLIVKLDGQVGAVIDTILLIARAIMAVLYSRVIHSLKKDDEPEPPGKEDIEEWVTATMSTALQESLAHVQQEIVSQLEASLSLRLDERLAEWDAKQDTALAHLKEEQATLMTETVTNAVETATAGRQRASISPAVSSPKVRSITEAASRKRVTGGPLEIDKTIWPLLNTSLSVRQVAAKAQTSTATVGRSRQRWEKAKQSVSVSETERDAETDERAW
jgi:hypothetical protein